MPAANPRVWLVTGSSRGLGLAIATAALDSGDSVIATARKTSDLQHLVDKYGHRVFPLALDVSKNEEVVEVVEKGCAHFNRIDVVVNNAGYANTAAVEDIEVSDFEAQINTNLLGVFYVSKAVLPILRTQGGGHIFQISSLGGRLGAPGLRSLGVPSGQVGRWWILHRPLEGGRSPRHQGHRPRAQRHSDRLGWVVNGHPARQRALPADRRRIRSVPQVVRRNRALHPIPHRSNHPSPT